MKWHVNADRKEATTAEGYLINWAESTRGAFFNGYGPPHPRSGKRKHLEASYKRDVVKAACEAHLLKTRGAEAA